MNWRTVPLVDLLSEHRGGYWGADLRHGLIAARVVRNSDVAPAGIAWERTPTRGFSEQEYASAHLDPGNIVVTSSGDCGRVAYLDEVPEPAIASNFVRVLRINEERAFPRYVFHWMNSPEARRKLSPFIRGTTLQNLAVDSAVRSLQAPTPPLNEQRRIAAILDQADALYRKRHETIRLTVALLRSAFLEMFGDPVRNPKDWRSVSLGETVSARGAIVDGPFGSSMKPDTYVEQGVRVIRNFNIRDDCFNASDFRYVTPEKFAEVKRSEVRPGDVLLSTKGTLGNACLMPDLEGEAVLSATGSVRIRLPDDSELLPGFLVAQLIQPSYKLYMKSHESGSNQKYLNLTGIRRFRVVVPPRSAQAEFLGCRTRVLETAARATAALNATGALFESLRHRAFRGEL